MAPPSRNFFTFTSFILHIVIFALLLCVSLSALVIKDLYLFILPYVNSYGGDLRFGPLGFCDTLYALVTVRNCFGSHRGYTVPYDVAENDGLPFSVAGMLDRPLVAALILHPIGAGFAALCAIFALYDASQPLSRAALSLSIWNAILVTIAFAADVAVVAIAKSRVDDAPLIAYWGAGPWMTLAAAICTWISVALLSVKAWKYGGNRKSMGVAPVQESQLSF